MTMVVEKYTSIGRLHVQLGLNLGRSIEKLSAEEEKHPILFSLHDKTDSRINGPGWGCLRNT